ncbi:hypothetical protein PJL15_04189 [Paenarthrobacter nitroguajacolicus]|nr:hypothetical protein [Paenarthrobacter nitroguajacolicus]
MPGGSATRLAENIGGRAAGVETSGGETYATDAVLVACSVATPAVVKPLRVETPRGSPVCILVVTKPVEHLIPTKGQRPRYAICISVSGPLEFILAGPDRAGGKVTDQTRRGLAVTWWFRCVGCR